MNSLTLKEFLKQIFCRHKKLTGVKSYYPNSKAYQYCDRCYKRMT